MTMPIDNGGRRQASVERTTAETRVALTIDLDTAGETDVATGIGFLDHLFTAFARHARIALHLRCTGDLAVDDHHTAEDCALALGRGIGQALGERRDIARFGSAYAPLDESLARAVVDVSGRGVAVVDLGLRREAIGGLACENVAHVLRSLAVNAGLTVHVDVLRGENDHHRAEAAFKALALAFRQAIARADGVGVPSTKGLIEGMAPAGGGAP